MRSVQIVLLTIIALFLGALVMRGGVPGEQIASARLADDDHPAPRIAVCQALTIANELMATDRFAPERAEFEEELRASLQEILSRMGEVRGQIQDLDPESEEAGARRNEFMQLQQQFQRANQQAQMAQEQFIVGQLREAYDLVRTSARAIAESRGFNYLLDSMDPESDVVDGPMAAVRSEIGSRNVLLMPDGVDITEDVRADLNLD